eukprot:TRINITY_DN8779_c0_g1_i1.p1 TRINITY_DN8779_c0_g1~~TRINITY_DN8779_c0_g1_i1.p1  ORF type:complete len:191 (-),score=12.13 TRINITY_DN8779_c0_g1_i1:308-880(-)
MSSKYKLFGVPLKASQSIHSAISNVHGLGRYQAATVCARLGLNPRSSVENVGEILPHIRKTIERHYLTQADLQRAVGNNILRLIKIGCRRGVRHQLGLPVNGQKAKPNGKTQKRLAPIRARMYNYKMIAAGTKEPKVEGAPKAADASGTAKQPTATTAAPKKEAVVPTASNTRAPPKSAPGEKKSAAKKS